jgi:hypothetical protein
VSLLPDPYERACCGGRVSLPNVVSVCAVCLVVVRGLHCCATAYASNSSSSSNNSVSVLAMCKCGYEKTKRAPFCVLARSSLPISRRRRQRTHHRTHHPNHFNRPKSTFTFTVTSTPTYKSLSCVLASVCCGRLFWLANLSARQPEAERARSTGRGGGEGGGRYQERCERRCRLIVVPARSFAGLAARHVTLYRRRHDFRLASLPLTSAEGRRHQHERSRG